MALIELRKISKAYGSVPALRELDLTVPEGCLYGLLGPNGAGKTTAMRILATLLAPDSGSVVVGGVDGLVQQREVRQLMGYVAQEVAIDKILSGRELLQLQGDLYHLPRNDRDSRIADLIDRLAMGDWIDRRCGTYSGGMRRRLDLAAGLVCCTAPGCSCSMNPPWDWISRAAVPSGSCCVSWLMRAPLFC